MKILSVRPPDELGRVRVTLDEKLVHDIAPPTVFDSRTKLAVSGGPAQLDAGRHSWVVGQPGSTFGYLVTAKTAHDAWTLLGLGEHFSAMVVRQVEMVAKE